MIPVKSANSLVARPLTPATATMMMTTIADVDDKMTMPTTKRMMTVVMVNR